MFYTHVFYVVFVIRIIFLLFCSRIKCPENTAASSLTTPTMFSAWQPWKLLSWILTKLCNPGVRASHRTLGTDVCWPIITVTLCSGEMPRNLPLPQPTVLVSSPHLCLRLSFKWCIGATLHCCWPPFPVPLLWLRHLLPGHSALWLSLWRCPSQQTTFDYCTCWPTVPKLPLHPHEAKSFLYFLILLWLSGLILLCALWEFLSRLAASAQLRLLKTVPLKCEYGSTATQSKTKANGSLPSPGHKYHIHTQFLLFRRHIFHTCNEVWLEHILS